MGMNQTAGNAHVLLRVALDAVKDEIQRLQADDLALAP